MPENGGDSAGSTSIFGSGVDTGVGVLAGVGTRVGSGVLVGTRVGSGLAVGMGSGVDVDGTCVGVRFGSVGEMVEPEERVGGSAVAAVGAAIDGSTSGSFVDEQASNANSGTSNIAEGCRLVNFNAKILRNVPRREITERRKLHHIGHQHCQFGNRERLTLFHSL